MSKFNRQQPERLSRQQAAERLIDIAYTLTAGGPLELSVDGQRIKVPMANELGLERELTADGDEVELDVTLTWSSPEG